MFEDDLETVRDKELEDWIDDCPYGAFGTTETAGVEYCSFECPICDLCREIAQTKEEGE